MIEIPDQVGDDDRPPAPDRAWGCQETIEIIINNNKQNS